MSRFWPTGYQHRFPPSRFTNQVKDGLGEAGQVLYASAVKSAIFINREKGELTFAGQQVHWME